MKKIVVGAALMLAAGLVMADGMTLWQEKMPGYRKPFDTTLLPEKVFSSKTQVETNSAAAMDSKLKSEIDKLASLKVTGLVWSDQRENRRVLMGDIVMREGQAIPAYVFEDGRVYVLLEIGRSSLRFRAEGADQSNPFAFEVPFGLKNPIRNQSDFSSSKDDKK